MGRFSLHDLFAPASGRSERAKEITNPHIQQLVSTFKYYQILYMISSRQTITTNKVFFIFTLRKIDVGGIFALVPGWYNVGYRYKTRKIPLCMLAIL